jgi:hypothetical protein
MAVTFMQKKVIPTAKELKLSFGVESAHYNLFMNNFGELWNRVKDNKDIRLQYENWGECMQLAYGSTPTVEIFFAHTYFVTLIKILLYLKTDPDANEKEIEVTKIIDGTIFAVAGIANLIEDDYTLWISDKRIIDRAKIICHNLISTLKNTT